MRKLFAIVAEAYITVASSFVFAESDDETLLNAFHKYGITKCDKLILKHSKLKGDWNFFISKHRDIDASTPEASIIQIRGTKNDTVKEDDSYLQTQKACFLTSRSTTTASGPCKENVNGDFWYVSKEMTPKDYTQYKNKGGVELYAKEIEVGNFKACIQEIVVRDSSPHG